jgi:uncharacterized protein
MHLKEKIQDDMKNAMRAKEAQRLSAIRLILAAIKQYEVDKRVEVDDAIVLSLLDKMLKQRRDSIEQYQKANRQDLVDQETFEVNIIQAYLPAQLSEAEISALVDAAVAATGASSAKDMGKVMAELKPKLQGRADMTVVGAKVKERLG